MAYYEQPQIISLVAGATMSSASMYKLAFLDSSGHVVTGSIGTTGPRICPIGVIYGFTHSTSTDAEAIPVAIGGVVKVKLSTDSTLNSGDFIAASSKAYGCVPEETLFVCGRILKVGDTGDNPVASVLWGAPFGAPSTAKIPLSFLSSNNT